jgi:hypothetical protein
MFKKNEYVFSCQLAGLCICHYDNVVSKINLLKPGGRFMYHLIQHSHIVRPAHSEQIILMDNNSWLVLIMQREIICCAVWPGSFNI